MAANNAKHANKTNINTGVFRVIGVIRGYDSQHAGLRDRHAVAIDYGELLGFMRKLFGNELSGDAFCQRIDAPQLINQFQFQPDQ